MQTVKASLWVQTQKQMGSGQHRMHMEIIIIIETDDI